MRQSDMQTQIPWNLYPWAEYMSYNDDHGASFFKECPVFSNGFYKHRRNDKDRRYHCIPPTLSFSVNNDPENWLFKKNGELELFNKE